MNTQEGYFFHNQIRLRNIFVCTGNPAKLLKSSMKTKKKRSASYQETGCFVSDICLLILELSLICLVPNSMHDQCHQCRCCQPFFCGSSSCNKQDTLLGQCRQEAASCPLVPEEFIWGTVAQVLSALHGQDGQVMLKNRGNAQCSWNSELAFKQYL